MCIDLNDQVPMVKTSINGVPIKNVYVDGGVAINVINEQTMQQVGLKSDSPSLYKIKMADNSRAKATGAVTDVKMDVYNIATLYTFHVHPTKLDRNAYPIILGKPWLRQVGALQKWAIA